MFALAQSDSIVHWVYTNAPAAWISAAIAIITCVILVRSRKKPKRLVVREIRNSTLVRIWPGVRHKIKMTFADQPIRKLGQIEGQIFNEGSEVIQNPTFNLTLPNRSRILDVLITPEDLNAMSTIVQNKLTIALPYLNPVHDHRQILKMSILVDGSTEPITVSGGGEGWSVRHAPLVNPKKTGYMLILGAASPILLIILWFFYGLYLEKHHGIGMSEVSFRSFLYNSPVLILVLGLSLFLLRRGLGQFVSLYPRPDKNDWWRR